MAMINNFKRMIVLFTGFAALLAGSPFTRAQVLESWENQVDPLDGWVSPQNWIGNSDHTIGVTDGVQSLHMRSPNNAAAGDSPTYGQMLRSPFSQLYTTELASAFELTWDVTNVYLPAGPATGGVQQWDIDINNSDTGFVSLTGFSYPAATLPNQAANSPLTYRFVVTVPSTLRNELAASLNPTQIIFQVGGGNTPGNDQFWIDNLTTGVIPEPTSFSFIVISTLPLLRRRRK